MTIYAVMNLILATLILLVIIVIIAIPYLLIVRIMEFCMIYTSHRTEKIRISDLYDTLKTGDLLLFTATVNTPMNIAFSHVYYSHIGVIVEDGHDDLGAKLYVSESQMATELMPLDLQMRRVCDSGDEPESNLPARPEEYHMKNGCSLAPLLVRIKYYVGFSYVMRLSRPLSPTATIATKSRINELINCAWPYPTMAQNLHKLLFPNSKVRAHHCFQHVAHILETAGIIPPNNMGSLELCKYISEMSGKILNDGYFYSAPVQIVYDI